MILQPGAPRISGASELGCPERSLSPRSDLSVPSNPTRSAQSLPSYNPFEDEDDTGSTVSEKEDVKPKTLVNKCFLRGPPRSLCLSLFLCPGPRPLGAQPMHEARGRWPGCQLWTLREGGTSNSLWLLLL